MAVVLELADARVCVDEAATAAAYRLVLPDPCLCCLCENFRAAWGRGMGVDLEPVLRELGVDPERPAEIVHYCRTAPGAHMYTAEWAVLVAAEGATGRSVRWTPTRAGVTLDVRDAGVPVPRPLDRPGLTRWLLLTVADVPWVIGHAEPS